MPFLFIRFITYTRAKACSISAIISSICSVPMLRRIVEGSIPCSFSSASDNWLWVVLAGCMARLFISATFASREKSFSPSINLFASSLPPFMSNVNIEPPPFGNYLLYNSLSRRYDMDGWFTCATFGWTDRNSTTFIVLKT